MKYQNKASIASATNTDEANGAPTRRAPRREQPRATSKVASTDTRTPGDDSAPPGKSSKATQDKTLAIEKAVSRKKDWIAPAIDVRATYARVLEPVALRGLWRLDGRRTKRLTDAYVQVLRVERPHSANRRAYYRKLVLRFTDKNGVSKDFAVTDDQLLDTHLANKLAGFATYPEHDVDRRYFSEAIQSLARGRETVIQDETETLGWQTLPDGTLVWGCVNGCETRAGFVPREQSPFLGPELSALGHGYYGQAVTPEMLASEYDWWDLRLNKYALHPDVQAWQAATIGLTAIVMLPDGIAPEGMGVEDGRLRVSPEVVGDPGVGKSREVNNMLTAYGARFRWDTSPLLTLGKAGKGDTGLGRNGTLATMKHHLVADGDHKASPGTPDFPLHHENRNSTISLYTDGDDGGKKGQRRGGITARDVPSGCVIRTCNYDHARVSIDEGNEMIERRACTFVWPNEVKGDNEVSRLLDETRLQGYATWQAYRQWIMERVAANRDAFKDFVGGLSEVAHALVGDEQYTWVYDLHRNHTELMILGLLLFQQFLEGKRSGYWLARWVETHISELVENRVRRGLYIRELAMSREAETGMETFVLTTLRSQFSTASVYIRSQQDTLLTEPAIDGSPFSLKDIGYRSVIRESSETWEAGRQCIGYLVHGGQDIALDPGLLMDVLKREGAKKDIAIGTEKHLLNALVEKGVLVPTYDKEGHITRTKQHVKIANRDTFLPILPMSVLYPIELVPPGEGDAETDDLPDEETPSNVTRFPTLTHAVATADEREKAVNGEDTSYSDGHATADFDMFNLVLEESPVG